MITDFESKNYEPSQPSCASHVGPLPRRPWHAAAKVLLLAAGPCALPPDLVPHDRTSRPVAELCVPCQASRPVTGPRTLQPRSHSQQLRSRAPQQSLVPRSRTSSPATRSCAPQLGLAPHSRGFTSQPGFTPHTQASRPIAEASRPASRPLALFKAFNNFKLNYNLYKLNFNSAELTNLLRAAEGILKS